MAAVGAALAALALSDGSSGQALRGDGASWRPVVHRRPTDADRSAFRIGGKVGGLYPGATRQLSLDVYNPQRFAIVVTSITTSVGRPRAGCAGSNMTVAAFSGALRVPSHSSVHVSVAVTLERAAPNACQGALFPFAYSGQARRA